MGTNAWSFVTWSGIVCTLLVAVEPARNLRVDGHTIQALFPWVRKASDRINSMPSSAKPDAESGRGGRKDTEGGFGDTRGEFGDNELHGHFQVEQPLLWPLPAFYKDGTSKLCMSQLQFSLRGPDGVSAFMSQAFRRYRKLIFSHVRRSPGEDGGVLRSAADGGQGLRELTVHVASQSEELQLETDESYSLVVPDDGSEAILKAETIYGALRGLETFSQLCTYDFDEHEVFIHNAPWHIEDLPRFPHRGLLIDTSRHFQPVKSIKRVIQSMEYAKLNVLHWHIVDEESFPVEIPSYPKLWEGAYSHSERYTMDDVKDIVEYARLHGVRVMAELDVPGHAASWGVGYPELWPSETCTEPLDITKDFTFEVIEGILTDFAKVFPYKLLHLGGDEVNTACWEKTPAIKDWLDKKGWTAHDAYASFVLRAQEIAVSKGWDPVNWEEPFDEFGDKLSNRTIVHNWLGPGTAPRVVAKGLRVIVSNQDKWYLDHLGVPYEAFYTNEPTQGIEDPEQQKLVLGGEVCMWGETVDASNIEQTIWPRAAAAAERLWSPRVVTDKGPEVALNRYRNFRCLLTNRGVQAAPGSNFYARTAPRGPGSCFNQ